MCAPWLKYWFLAMVCGACKVSMTGELPTAATASPFQLMEAPHHGRPAYANKEGNVFLYFLDMQQDSSNGRWMVGEVLGSLEGWAYVDSFAVTPLQIAIVSPLASWQVAKDGVWGPVAATLSLVECDMERTFHLSTNNVRAISGFYYETGSTINERPVFHQAAGNSSSIQHKAYFLDGKWMFGEEAGVDSARYFSICQEPLPYLCSALNDSPWKFHRGKWQQDQTTKITVGTPAENVHMVLRRRNAKKSQLDFKMNNGLPLPAVGLGTGGAVVSDETIKMALGMGYQLLDSASAYQNEERIGAILKETGKRDSTFLVSKVWYTELGFKQTLESVRQSLRKLATSHLDLELIHWPQCHESISWMDCSGEETGRWQDSWRALEKLYAEGFVHSIGVSNYDATLLKELLSFASAPPQVVQNFADPTNPDAETLSFCREHGIVLQAYSPLRSLALARGKQSEHARLKKRIKKVAKELAAISKARGEGGEKKGLEIALKFMLELGVAVVPRASSEEHLKANLDLLNWSLSPKQKKFLSPKTPSHLHVDL